MVSPTLSLGHRNDYRFHGFVVSWFCGFAHPHLLVIKMTVGFAVSWFSCFIHYCRFRGFEVSWFRLLCLWVIKITIGFMVSWFRPLPSLKMSVGFVVSPTLSLGH